MFLTKTLKIVFFLAILILVACSNENNKSSEQGQQTKEKKVIFDGCSAPGGKMRYINEYTNGKSSINSYDIDNKSYDFFIDPNFDSSSPDYDSVFQLFSFV